MTTTPLSAGDRSMVSPLRLLISDLPPPPRAQKTTSAGVTSDTECIRASLTDPQQFALLFDRHATTVHRYLSRRVGDLADDLLSETFLVAFRRRASYYQVHAEVRPWLLGIATHLVQGHRRTENRRLRALARTPDPGPEPPVDIDAVADRVTAAALRRPVADALAGLRDGDRDVLLLVAYEQLSYDEVAAVLDIPVGTVRSRLHRARQRTRAALADHLPNDSKDQP